MKRDILPGFFLFMIIFSLLSIVAFPQDFTYNASLGVSGIAGTKERLPFWFTSNQLGRYSTVAEWQQLTEGELHGHLSVSRKIKLDFGADMALAVSNKETKAKIIQAYAGLSWKILAIKVGAYADEEVSGGLSASNGNIIRSLNYRPYPMVRLSTSGYIPFLFAKRWFRFKAEYDEGILYGDRIIDRPHLHHDMLSFLFLTGKTSRFSVGVDRYVFWGGRSGYYGQLPADFHSYIHYILGLKGNSNFPEGDQENVAGNQLGSYLLVFEKDMANCKLEIRISHPFEDGSGMQFYNYKDNMYSFYIRRNKAGSPVDEFLFEYLHTKHQSGSNLDFSGRWIHPYGRDDYFNHSLYRTGFSYLGHSMGTPLFFPLQSNDEGYISGFENNRVSAFHAGFRGYLSENLSWKALFTYSRNFGTYEVPYDPVRKQFSSFAEFSWRKKPYPFIISTQVAADFGDLSGECIGLGLAFKYLFGD
jgi:hypothetical protein